MLDIFVVLFLLFSGVILFVAGAVWSFVSRYRTLLSAIGCLGARAVLRTKAKAVTVVPFHSIIRLFAGINQRSPHGSKLTADVLPVGIGWEYVIMFLSEPNNRSPHVYTVVLVVLPDSEADFEILGIPGDSNCPPVILRSWNSGPYLMRLYALTKNDKLVFGALGALWVDCSGEAILLRRN